MQNSPIVKPVNDIQYSDKLYKEILNDKMSWYLNVTD